MPRLLLAEDDAGISDPLERALTREGYEVEIVADGAEAARRGVEGEHDLLVLDVGLPSLDGLEVCRRVREARPRVPVLILTARAEELDAVQGLDAGADDYVTKPFRLAELLARIRALMRRVEPPTLAARGVRVDPDARRAWRDERELELTPKEFDLLVLLIGDAGRVVTRERAMSEVWDENWFGSTKTLDMHLSSLRRKLGDDANAPELITTVRGVGFRFEPDH
ncbi:MAG TPA: response regulator transcription factor [Solirubrobacteraceae bacterium]|jgi:DNA-binding response OmpR family regulator|nr:response regulator transcription factor [Solirubrobacteraceae bacterium]